MPKKAKLGILGLAVVIITAAILLPMTTCTTGPPSLVIKGTVKDAQTGEPIAGARVFDDGYAHKPDWEQIKADVRSEWGAITNSAGEYSFLTWPEHHCIKVEAPGYKTERQTLYDGHFVFNKKDEETFNFALESEEASDSSEFKTKLPNGVTVELIGICEHPSEGKQWWKPDGTELSKEIRVRTRGGVSANGIPYTVAVKVTMPEDATFELGRIKGATGGLILEAVDSEGRPISNMRAWMVYIDEKLTETSIQLGAATGPWKTRARNRSKGGMSTAGIVFSKAYESDGGVRIIVADEHLDLDYRITAIDTQGKEHVFHQRGGSAGKVRQTTALFHDLKLNQIEYFLFQTRPYKWVEFKNVSLRPEHKTDVQVEIEPEKPAGQVQGEGGAGKQLSSGGGYQNLNREQRERLERLRANRQSLSYKNMQKLGLAVAVFANDHKGRCPSNLSDLRKYIADEKIFDWINQNVVYLGKNQEYRDPPDAVLAYDESMLKKPRQETNVLYNDAHVSFEKSEWLQEQGIILEQKPAGVGLNEKSINSDSKVKVGGIVRVEDKPVVGEWEDIGKAIPADFNDTVSLVEHITLGSIGQDVEGNTFITLLRDREKTQNQQYRFILVRRDGTVVEPANYNTLVFADKLWERFSFDMPYHHNQIKEFRLQRFPQNLARKASLPVVKPYDPSVNGKIAARATSAPPGRGALHFDGQGDYLYVPDSQSLWMKAPFTVEMWIKPEFPKEQFEGRPGWGLIGKGCIGKDWIFGRGKVEMRGFGITLHRFGDDPNLLMVDYCAANAGRVYTKPYGRRDFDDWMHLYHVFRPDRYTPGHTHPLVIGRFLTSEYPFAGKIGEIRIWAGARSRDQISEYRNKPLTGDEPGLVACWTFEQSGGQIAYDISANRNHARLGRTTDTDDADPTWVTVTGVSKIDKEPGNEADDQVLARSTVGPVGRHALSFDGVNDYLHVAANSTLTLKSPFSIEMWLKPDFSEIPRSKANEKLYPFLSLMRKGKRLFQEKKIQAGGFMMFVGPSSQPDWKCSAGLYLANTKGQAYQVDGFFGDRLQPVQPGWLYVSMSCTREDYILVPDQPLLIGENIVPSGFPFKGEIAEIRIWSKVLTDVDSLRYGYTSLAGSEPNLVACWDFKRPGGQIVYDIGPNGNHARLGAGEGPDDADPKWVDLKAALHQLSQKTDEDIEAKTGQSSSVGKKVTDIKLPFTFTIYTLTPDDKPQAGVKIRCVHPRPERAEPIVDMIEESDENGVATFTITKADLITDWIYWFSLADENYVGTPQVGITPDEENWTFKVLPAEEFELQVISDKRPVPDAKIYMYVDYNKGENEDVKRFWAFKNIRSDSTGRARTKFVKGKIDMAIAAKGYASKSIRGVQLSSDKPYLIVLNRGREIKGRVLDPNNKPLEGVSITAKKEEQFHYDEEFILKSSTDENGKFTLKDASPGQWKISARSEDPAKPYFIAPITMKVRRWWPVRTIKMVAKEGFRLKGKYLTNYKINLKNDGGLPYIWGWVSKPGRAWLQLRTKQDGTFDIWGFPCEGQGSIEFVGVGGYHNFVKMPEEYGYFKIFGNRLNFENVPPGTYENVEVHYLLAGQVSGTVVDADGKPWPGLEVVARPRGKDKTDKEGKYSIWVPPGDNVWLKVQYPKRGPIFTSDMFSVKEGQVIEKNFVVKQNLRD